MYHHEQIASIGLQKKCKFFWKIKKVDRATISSKCYCFYGHNSVLRRHQVANAQHNSDQAIFEWYPWILYCFESGITELLSYYMFLTESIQPHDPRAREFDEAMWKEAKGLLNFWHLERGLLTKCSGQSKHFEWKVCFRILSWRD